ncbi:MAG: NifU family protein [Bacilli bacterium]|jgi:Fe-S cluster biogenesis protein NfuA
MSDIETRITGIINKLKPFLNQDGGDIEFVKFENGTVYVKFYGACQGCPMIDQTLKDGIEMALTEEIPEVKRVEKIDE